MDSSYNNNKFLLEALDVLLHHFRDIFKARWKLLCDYNWTDTEKDATTFLVLFEKKIKMNKTQRKVFETGITNTWDISLLKLLLKELKGVGAKAQLEDSVLTRVGDVRNQLSHSAGGIKKEDFEGMWKELEQCLRDLGKDLTPLNKIRDVKKGQGAAPKPAESKEMLSLKETGNAHLQKGDLSEAIKCYTQAVKLPGLTTQQQSILFCNRAHAHTLQAGKATNSQQREEEFEAAKVDAKMAKSLLPAWSRPYYRIGRILHLQKKYVKAIENFNIALAIDPNNQEAKDAKAESASELGKFERGETMDPAYLASPIRYEKMREDGLLTHSETQIRNAMEMAENMGIKEGYVMKAHAYRDGIHGYKQDFVHARSLYAKAAEMGSPDGMYNLGQFCANGNCGKVDLKGAVEWWRKAAAFTFDATKGHPNVGIAEAEHALGLAYMDGLGVEKDENQAVAFFERAAHHGYAGSYNNLGILYANGGTTIVKNTEQARLYYRAASMKGDTNAMVNLGLMEHREMNFAAGKKWILRAAEKGNFHAQQLVESLKLHSMPAIDPLIEGKFKEHMLGYNKLFETPSTHLSAAKNSDKYPYEALVKYADKSKVAASMLQAKKHWVDAMQFIIDFGEAILDNVSTMKKFAYHAALSFRITEICFISTPLCLKVIRRLLEKDPNNVDAMLCFLSLSPDLTENLAFIKGWIAKGITFPRMYELQGQAHMMQKREKEAVASFHLALKADSSDYSLYYSRATAYRFVSMPCESLADYENFLKNGEPDDRKIPNAYFGMAQLHLKLGDMAAAEKCYETGCDKAKSALPFFSSEATMQEATNQLLHMQKSILRAERGEKISITDLPPLPPSTHTEEVKDKKLRDLRRIEIIVRERQKYHAERGVIGDMVKTTTPPLKKQPAISSLANLKPIFIEDIDLQKDAVYKGSILSCTILGPFSIYTGAYTLIEDEKGDVERLGLYNFGFNTGKQFEATFWVGKKISIINPYLRIGMDDKPFIRVDEPATVIAHTAIRKNVCALCFSEEHLQKCAKCSAYYCSKKCQEIDWTIFKHKFICN